MTNEGLEPHIYRAFYNAYTTMHVLDIQLHIEIGELVPVDYGFTLLRMGIFCHCGICARVLCREALVKSGKCQKMENCKNPHNSDTRKDTHSCTYVRTHARLRTFTHTHTYTLIDASLVICMNGDYVESADT